MAPQEVATLRAEHYQHISSSNNYSPEFLAIKNVQEQRALNFIAARYYEYNRAFSLVEFKTALSRFRDTVPGQDEIHYQMLKNISDSAWAFLLAIYNKVYFEADFPRIWYNVTVLSFLKPNKAPDDRESYRPISLTSCLCKVLEKMVSFCLQYIVESLGALTPVQEDERNWGCSCKTANCYTRRLYSKTPFSRNMFWFEKGIWYHPEIQHLEKNSHTFNSRFISPFHQEVSWSTLF